MLWTIKHPEHGYAPSTWTMADDTEVRSANVFWSYRDARRYRDHLAATDDAWRDAEVVAIEQATPKQSDRDAAMAGLAKLHSLAGDLDTNLLPKVWPKEPCDTWNKPAQALSLLGSGGALQMIDWVVERDDDDDDDDEKQATDAQTEAPPLRHPAASKAERAAEPPLPDPLIPDARWARTKEKPERTVEPKAREQEKDADARDIARRLLGDLAIVEDRLQTVLATARGKLPDAFDKLPIHAELGDASFELQCFLLKLADPEPEEATT